MKQRLDRFLLAATLGLLGACSSSSSDGTSLVPIMESEPNGTFATANNMSLGQNAMGMLDTVGDQDWWQINLTEGQFITVQVFAERVDQATWVTNGDAASVKLYAPNGTDLLVEQSATVFQWTGAHDADIALFRVPATGTYFLAVEQENALAAAGEYMFSVTRTTFDNAMQFETEMVAATGDNDTPATAEPIVPGMVHGWHVDDESDFYEITTTVPSLLRFTVVGHRNGVFDGDTYYDPELSFYDGTETLLINNDDTFYLDSAIQYLALTPGTFYIEVTECCAAGDAPYQLFYESTPVTQLGTAVAESEPNDDLVGAQAIQFGNMVTGSHDGGADYYSFACNAGDRINVELFFNEEIEGGVYFPTVQILDSLGNVIDQAFSGDFGNIRTILTGAGTYNLAITTSARQGSPTPYAFRVTQTPSTFETEPNDTAMAATTFSSQGLAAGLMDAASDVDVFSFSASAGVPVYLDILASSSNSTNGFFNDDDFGSTMDPLLTIKNANGDVLMTGDSDAGYLNGIVDGLPTASLVFIPPTSGTFYLEVEETYGESGTDTFYSVRKR